jgi:hypothetical protein
MRRAATMVLLTLCTLGAIACGSWEAIGAPRRPIVGQKQGIRAEIVGALMHETGFRIDVRLSSQAAIPIVRATLSSEATSVCGGGRATRRISELDGTFILSFDPNDALAVLPSARTLALELDPTAEGNPPRCVTVDLGSSPILFVPGIWGLGGSVRYHPPGIAHSHYGHAVSGELGGDLWIGRTRLRLSYDFAFAGCDGTRPAQVAGCPAEDGMIPFGFGAYGTHYATKIMSYTLGLGLGYRGVAVFGRDITPEPAPQADPFLHGPRLALALFRNTPQSPRFDTAIPKSTWGIELTLDILGRKAFDELSLVPGIGFIFTAGSL